MPSPRLLSQPAFPRGQQVPGWGRHLPCQTPRAAPRPSMPAAQRPPPGSFSMARGHPGPAPRASRGNLAAGARSSPPNPAPCHRPRADGNEPPPPPARHMPFHKGSEPAGATRCPTRCRSLPARFQPSLHQGPGRGWRPNAPGEPETPKSPRHLRQGAGDTAPSSPGVQHLRSPSQIRW